MLAVCLSHLDCVKVKSLALSQDDESLLNHLLIFTRYRFSYLRNAILVRRLTGGPLHKRPYRQVILKLYQPSFRFEICGDRNLDRFKFQNFLRS